MSLIQVIQKEDYQILQLNRGKANPINLELTEAIRKEVKRTQNDDSIRGVIITGNTPGYFSVGLDLKELYHYDEQQIAHFWDSWNAMVIELAKYPKPIIAAINGYSPAGGCVIAVTCDHRVMAEDSNFIIGLNETAVGIAVPEYIFLLYQFWIGTNQAYQNLMDGRLLTSIEAYKCGLVDELCPTANVVEAAEIKLKSWLKKSDNILQSSKRNMRAQLIRQLESSPDYPLEEKLKSWFDPKSRAAMKAIVDKLSK